MAFSAAFAWGWAFPLVKLGFREFGILQDMTGSKMLFAGLRFCMAGILILLIARLTGRSFTLKRNGQCSMVLALQRHTLKERMVNG